MSQEKDVISAFHDNHVHGLQIVESEDGQGELILDIDHIVEWLCPNGGSFSFKVAPAYLTFHQIFNLSISVNYKSASAGICPFSIHEIHRQEFTYPSGGIGLQWCIELNWPNGEISFESAGFSLEQMAEPIETTGQYLSNEQRQAMLAANKSFKADK